MTRQEAVDYLTSMSAAFKQFTPDSQVAETLDIVLGTVEKEKPDVALPILLADVGLIDAVEKLRESTDYVAWRRAYPSFRYRYGQDGLVMYRENTVGVWEKASLELICTDIAWTDWVVANEPR